MSNKSYAIYKPVRPYFDLVRGALGDLVDGEHFFDCVADDIAYEVLYNFPGWPRVIQGRADLMESFRGYGKHIELHAADRLIKHSTDNGQFIVIEYEVHGTILATESSTTIASAQSSRLRVGELLIGGTIWTLWPLGMR